MPASVVHPALLAMDWVTGMRAARSSVPMRWVEPPVVDEEELELEVAVDVDLCEEADLVADALPVLESSTLFWLASVVVEAADP